MKSAKRVLIFIAAFYACSLQSQIVVQAVVNHASPTSTSSTGNITLGVSGGTSPYSYKWTPGGATTQNLSGVARNDYSVKIKDAAGDSIIYPYSLGYKTNWLDYYGVFRNDSILTGAPATSKNTLLANTDGWAEVVITDVYSYYLGFSDSLSLTDLHFTHGFYLNYYLYYYTEGTLSPALATPQPGDVIRIERIDTVFNLKLNGAIIATAYADKTKKLKLVAEAGTTPFCNVGASFKDSTNIYFANYTRDYATVKHCTPGHANGSISLTPRLSETHTYLWSAGGSTNAAVSSLSVSNYAVKVKDPNLIQSYQSYNVGYKTYWKNIAGLTFRNDSLLSGYGISKNTLLANTDGWTEFSVPSQTTSIIFGFSDSLSTYPNFDDLDFGVSVQYGGYVYFKFSSYYSLVAGVAKGDIIRIERVDTNLILKINGTVFGTQAAPKTKVYKLFTGISSDAIANVGASFIDSTGISFPNYLRDFAVIRHTTPGHSDGSITLTPINTGEAHTYTFSPGSYTANAASGLAKGTYTVHTQDADLNTCDQYFNVDYKVNFTNLNGIVQRNDSLIPTGIDLSTVSKNTLTSGTDGFAEVYHNGSATTYMFGFADSLSAVPNDYTDIDFGFYKDYNAYIYGIYQGQFTSLLVLYPAKGDLFRIERTDTMFYLKQNNVVLFSGAMPKNKNYKLKTLITNYYDTLCNFGASFVDSTNISFPNYVKVKPLIKHSTALNITDSRISLASKYGYAGNTYTWTGGGTTVVNDTLPNKGIGAYAVTVADSLKNTSTYTFNVLYAARPDSLQGCTFANDSLVVSSGWGTAVNDGVLQHNQDGNLQWVVPDSLTYAMLGYASAVSYTPGYYDDIENGFYLAGSNLYLAQSGSYSLLSSCLPGDLLEIKRQVDTVAFYQNGTTLYRYTSITTGLDWKIKIAIEAGLPGNVVHHVGTIGPGLLITYPPNAPDDNLLNWHLEETYDENGNVVNTEKTYLDNLGRGTQQLVKNATSEVFTSQTIYDGYGRAAISTMPAYTGSTLAYQSWFMRTQNGQVYDYPQFDASATLNSPVNPENTMHNVLGSYYSDNNIYDAYQATADNPYTRIEYTGDPGSSQRRVSKPGNAFKMGSGHESYSFMMISGDELKNVFGGSLYYKCKRNPSNYNQCIPMSTGSPIVATKQISMSPDNIETITYMVGNKVIASGYAGLTAAESCTYTSVNSIMAYNGTRDADIHLPDNDKTSLVLPMPVQATTPTTTTSYTNVVFGITDLYTDVKLLSGTDYTLNTGTGAVAFSSAFLSLYTGRSLMLRISFSYLSAYEASLLTAHVAPADLKAVYTLDYGRFSKNFYDIGGSLRMSVSPKGFSCSSPTVITMATNYDYNHHGQVIAKTSPDEGLVEMTYDTQGRLRFSQNDDQKIHSRFNYVNYDAHSRPYEVGEYQSLAATGNAWFTNYYLVGPASGSVGVTTEYILDMQDGLLDAQKTNTVLAGYTSPTGGAYDIPSGYTYYSNYQNFRNGVINFVKNKNSTAWFNYDKVGRKTATITQITETDFVAKTPNVDARIKTSESTYNFFTGITNSYTWQPNNTKEIVKYAYTYNANYQPTLTTIAYGTVAVQNLAGNYYNKMGQLNRVVSGNNYQGTDMVYTLGGGLKAINHPGLDASLDPGGDNGNYNGSGGVNKDLFGEMVEFYNNDYQRSGSNIGSSISSGSSKYNNLIYATRFKTRDVVNTTTVGASYVDWMGASQTQIISATSYSQQELAFTYTYDQFNQLATSTFNTYNNNSNAYSARPEYAETGASSGNIAYDRNGNITRLVRQAFNSTVLDNLTYTVGSTNNKLTDILDAASNSFASSFNFKTPSTSASSPFVYNAIGQMIHSSAEGIDTLRYYPDGRIKRIEFSNSNYTEYEYGASGEKLKSKFYDHSSGKIKYTWYIGPVIYEWDEAGANTFNIAEVNIPGGLLRVNAQATVGISSGYLVFKVTDHLGNVRVTYKGNGSGNGIDVLSFNDYYAFGGQLPGRSYTAEDYRYGYQGQEKSTATGSPWYQFDLRMYNQDIGRWFAPDPMGQFSSPYIGMANNPVSAVDPDGGFINIQQGGQYSREYMIQHQTGMFTHEEVSKRYMKEYNDIVHDFVTNDGLGDYRDVDKFIARILDLNNYYSGLAQDVGGLMVGLQTGIDYLTPNELQVSYAAGDIYALNNSAGKYYIEVANEGDQEMEMQFTGSAYEAISAEHDEINNINRASEAFAGLGLVADALNTTTDELGKQEPSSSELDSEPLSPEEMASTSGETTKALGPPEETDAILGLTTLQNNTDKTIWYKPDDNDKDPQSLAPGESTTERIDGVTHPDAPGLVFKVKSFIDVVYGVTADSKGVYVNSIEGSVINKLGGGGWLSQAPDSGWDKIFVKAKNP